MSAEMARILHDGFGGGTVQYMVWYSTGSACTDTCNTVIYLNKLHLMRRLAYFYIQRSMVRRPVGGNGLAGDPGLYPITTKGNAPYSTAASSSTVGLGVWKGRRTRPGRNFFSLSLSTVRYSRRGLRNE